MKDTPITLEDKVEKRVELAVILSKKKFVCKMCGGLRNRKNPRTTVQKFCNRCVKKRKILKFRRYYKDHRNKWTQYYSTEEYKVRQNRLNLIARRENKPSAVN